MYFMYFYHFHAFMLFMLFMLPCKVYAFFVYVWLNYNLKLFFYETWGKLWEKGYRFKELFTVLSFCCLIIYYTEITQNVKVCHV